MILKYNKYTFIKEQMEYLQEQFLNEDNFNQFQNASSMFGAEMGTYGFAVDPSLSIYGNQDGPYNNAYFRTPYMIQKVVDVMKTIYKDQGYSSIKYDHFLDDIDNYSDLKILRLHKNNNLYLDVFISFMFNDEEFFGVYKNFNGLQKPTLKSHLFSEQKYSYIDNEYILKFDNYIFKLLTNWFKPNKGFYVCLKDIVPCRNEMGETVNIKKGQNVRVLGVNTSKEHKPYILIDHNGDQLHISNNDYYYFHYWFDKLPG